MLDSCRNQKGFISQNCLFCCSFDFGFTYALIRWEGSAADARIFSDAIQTDLNVPHGWYFLADAGFPHCKELLVPYQGVQFRNGEKLTCGNVKFLCHCHSKLILHVYVGQRINKNFLTCIMHKPAMLSSIFLVSSSTSSISFWEHWNIIMQFRPRFLLLSAPFIISFVCMILMTRQRMTMKWWINKLMLEICLCIKKVGVNMPKMMLL